MTAGVAGVPDREVALAGAATPHPATVFVREHFTFVWRTLRRFGVPEAEVADAAQRVFVVATGRLDRIEPGKERAFLFGTVVKIADRVRRTRSRRPVFAESDPDLETSPWPSGEELLDQRRARQLLDAILDRLPEDLRAVFILYEIEQMTVKDIANLLDLPHGTAASRLRRARELFEERVLGHSSAAGDTP